MALLESAVVVYLRELYYPNGFVFPLSPMKSVVVLTELAREFATIVMLWTIAYIAGRNFSSRFAWFIIGFGIWDIFYYVFLYVFIQWPSSLFEWDILFLIPLPWYGPVIAPCVISVMMIALGILILYSDKWNIELKWNHLTISSMMLGCLIVLGTFMADFVKTMPRNILKPLGTIVLEHSQAYVPTDYSYGWFMLGIIFISGGLFIIFKENGFRKHFS